MFVGFRGYIRHVHGQMYAGQVQLYVTLRQMYFILNFFGASAEMDACLLHSHTCTNMLVLRRAVYSSMFFAGNLCISFVCFETLHPFLGLAMAW